MRLLAVSLAVVFLGCSSSSSSDTDGGTEGGGGGSSHKRHDAGPDAGHHRLDAGVDAANVCTGAYGVDSGVVKDARADGAPIDGALDGIVAAKDAGVDAKKIVDGGDAGDAAHDAAVPTCMQLCIAASPSSYQAFERYQVKECGCVANGACYDACHTSTTRSPKSTCGECLGAQTAEGLSSTCTLAAAADCSNDMTCAAYQTCAGACPM